MDYAAHIPPDISPEVCAVCGKSVDLETCKINENGQSEHGIPYFQRPLIPAPRIDRRSDVGGIENDPCFLFRRKCARYLVGFIKEFEAALDRVGSAHVEA